MLQVPGPEVAANTVRRALWAGTCRVLVQVPEPELVANTDQDVSKAGTCGFRSSVESLYIARSPRKQFHSGHIMDYGFQKFCASYKHNCSCQKACESIGEVNHEKSL